MVVCLFIGLFAKTPLTNCFRYDWQHWRDDIEFGLYSEITELHGWISDQDDFGLVR
jgi:hypothetical protein